MPTRLLNVNIVSVCLEVLHADQFTRNTLIDTVYLREVVFVGRPFTKWILRRTIR